MTELAARRIAEQIRAEMVDDLTHDPPRALLLFEAVRSAEPFATVLTPRPSDFLVATLVWRRRFDDPGTEELSLEYEDWRRAGDYLREWGMTPQNPLLTRQDFEALLRTHHFGYG